jgi:hypothetical protein
MTSKKRGLKYLPLDYQGGYIFSSGVAYGQLNQVLDLAATKPRKAPALLMVAEGWLKIIEKLDEEGEQPRTPIGFQVNTPRGEETDDSDESQE